MPKNTCYEKCIEITDYNKSLNRIMILGLTGMVALGASMLIIENQKTNTPNKQLQNKDSNTKTTLKLPTFTKLIF